jgi:hypothetical protein
MAPNALTYLTATLSRPDVPAVVPQGKANRKNRFQQFLQCDVMCSLPWKHVYWLHSSGLSALMSQYGGIMKLI